jgi:hypothetical protein
MLTRICNRNSRNIFVSVQSTIAFETRRPDCDGYSRKLERQILSGSEGGGGEKFPLRLQTYVFFLVIRTRFFFLCWRKNILSSRRMNILVFHSKLLFKRYSLYSIIGYRSASAAVRKNGIPVQYTRIPFFRITKKANLYLTIFHE